MTKVQKQFQLEQRASADSEALLENINRAQAIYGIERIAISPALDQVTVLFDASRLRVADIEATLRRCGLPILQPAPPEPVVTAAPAAPNQA